MVSVVVGVVSKLCEWVCFGNGSVSGCGFKGCGFCDQVPWV